jgi:Ca-activated chloride channel family protein
MPKYIQFALLAVAALSGPLVAQEPGVFRGVGDMVRVFVTVTDRDDRIVTSLTREQFEVRDNGRVQPLALFDNTPQPVRLVVMLDVSGSMAGNLSLLRAASDELFTRLRPDDLVRVGSFGREIDISPTFTGDRRTLVAALPRFIDPEAPTPLWRAVDQAMDAFGAIEGRRVVLVLSDGKDGGPRRFGERYIGQLEVVDRARREDVMIYGIGLHSRQAAGRMPAPGANLAAMMAADFPDPGLGTAAIESGGGYMEIRPRQDLGAAFARVADELHSQYLLGFTPQVLDGKSHKIEVRVSDRTAKPRARKSYVAPKATK